MRKIFEIHEGTCQIQRTNPERGPMQMKSTDRLRASFPKALRDEVDVVVGALPPASHEIQSTISDAIVSGERISIPARVYLQAASIPDDLSPTGADIWRCIYSRHHDGHVRETALRELLRGRLQPWVVPFVLQLTGEHVVEIVLPILEAELERQDAVLDFVDENGEFLALTESRATSYWNAYYRAHGRVPRSPSTQNRWYFKEDYPGLRLLRRLREASEART